MARLPAELSGIAYINDALNNMGLSDVDPCNPSTIVDGISKAIEEWSEEVTRAVDTMSFKIGGNFLVAVATIVKEVLNDVNLDILNNMILSGASSLASTLLSTLLGALSAVAGADMVFQYYQVRSLRDQLQTRIGITNELLRHINSTIQFLRALTYSSGNSFTAGYSLRDVIARISDARKILSYEKTRITNRERSKQVRPINKGNIKVARTKILQGVSILTDSYYAKISGQLSAMEQRYGLQTKHPSGNATAGETASLVVWFNYLSTLWVELKERYFVYENREGTAAYEQEKKNKQRIYYNIMADLIPSLPDTLQALLLKLAIGGSITTILQKVPVSKTSLSQIEAALNDTMDGGVNIADYVKETTLFNIDLNDLAGSFASSILGNDDETLQAITSEIKYSEAMILAFPETWADLLYLGSFQLSIMESVIDSLWTKEVEMRDALLYGMGDSELAGQKLEWALGLLGDSEKLKILLESDDVLNSSNLANQLKTAGVALQDLKDFIMDKNFDYGTKKAKKEPVELAIGVAQKHLAPLVNNTLILLSGKVTGKILATLQSIKLLLEQQYRLDVVELKLCNEYIYLMEANPTFAALKSYIDNLLNAFSQTVAGASTIALLAGDLNSVINDIQNSQDLNDLVKAIDCGEILGTDDERPYGFLDNMISIVYGNPFDPSDTYKKIESLNKEITEGIKTLKEKKYMLVDWIEEIKLQIQRAQEAAVINVNDTQDFAVQNPKEDIIDLTAYDEPYR